MVVALGLQYEALEADALRLGKQLGNLAAEFGKKRLCGGVGARGTDVSDRQQHAVVFVQYCVEGGTLVGSEGEGRAGGVILQKQERGVGEDGSRRRVVGRSPTSRPAAAATGLSRIERAARARYFVREYLVASTCIVPRPGVLRAKTATRPYLRCGGLRGYYVLRGLVYHARRRLGNRSQGASYEQRGEGWSAVVVLGFGSLWAERAGAQDWSQWRGDHRDGKAAEFSVPAAWPKELTKKWEVAIGDGVATPSLVGDRLYVFSRQEGNEIARCLDAGDGRGDLEGFVRERRDDRRGIGLPGSAVLADGCGRQSGDAGRARDSFVSRCGDRQGAVAEGRFPGKWPMFYTSSSPLIVDGLCIAQLGGSDDGGHRGLRPGERRGEMALDGRRAFEWFAGRDGVRRHQGRHRADGQEPGRCDGGRWQASLEDSVRAGPRHDRRRRWSTERR